MGSAAFFCIVIFYLIQSSSQFYVCSKPADVYFVVDTSSGDLPLLDRQKDYLQELVPLLPLSSAIPIRVGLVTYGATPTLFSPLGAAPSLPLLKKAILDMPLVAEGPRNTAKALKFLREKAFPEAARPGVRQVVILMTSGHSADRKRAAQEAAALRDQGVYVYALTTGSADHQVDWDEVTEMASSPKQDFVFSTDDQVIKGSLMELLNIRPCDYELLPGYPDTVEKVCAPRREADMVFAVDHLALGTSKSRAIITFIQAMLSEVDAASPLKTTLLASTDPLPLSSTLSPTQLMQQTLTGLHFPDLSELLTHAAQLLSTSGSRHSQKVLVLFLDDKRQKITKHVMSAAQISKKAKVDIYVVFLYQEGGRTRNDMADVEKLASGPSHVIRVPGYIRQLQQERSLVEDTLSTVCKGL